MASLSSMRGGDDERHVMVPKTPEVQRAPGRNGGGATASFYPAYHLGIAFFLTFAALMPTQNLLTSLNGTLGYYSIAVLYFCMAVAGPAAPFVVQYFGGPKGALVASAFTYLVFQVANVLVGIKSIPSAVNYVILLPPSALVGVGACVLWTAEGIYATRVSKAYDDQAAANRLDDGNEARNTLGFVNGLVLLFLQSANLVMNLASSALLSSGASAVTLFIVLAALSGAGWISYIFLPVVTSEEDRAANERTLSESINDILALHRERKLLILLSLFVLCGFNQGYLWSAFTADVVTASLGKEWIGYVMATSAAVDALGSYLFGFLSDRFGRNPLFIFGIIVNLVPCIILTIIGVPDGNSYALIFGIGIFLGIADAVWMTITSALLAEEFPGQKTTSAFAAFTMWRSFTTALMSLLGPFIPFSSRTIILGASIVVFGITKFADIWMCRTEYGQVLRVDA